MFPLCILIFEDHLIFSVLFIFYFPVFVCSSIERFCFNFSLILSFRCTQGLHSRGGCRTAAASKMNLFVIIVRLPAVNYYHEVLHLGCCSSPIFTTAFITFHCLPICKYSLFCQVKTTKQKAM